MADLPDDGIIRADGTFDFQIPQRGRYMFSIGNGDLQNFATMLDELWQTTDFTVTINNSIYLKDENGTDLNAITTPKAFIVDLPLGTLLRIVSANTTTPPKITVKIALIEAT